MKIPKEIKRYCPHCNSKTLQKVDVAKQKSRSATHPMSWGSQMRAKARGVRSGTGNKGRWGSRPPIAKWKRKSKQTKRMTILYTCTICKKSKQIKKAIRTGRLEIGEKVAK
jgi:large subunit ribosomal protein L44e